MPKRSRPAAAAAPVQPKAGKKIVFGEDTPLGDIDDELPVQRQAEESDADTSDEDDHPEVVGLATGRQAAEDELNKAESSKQAQRKAQQARSAKIQARKEKEDAEKAVRARMARAMAQAEEEDESGDSEEGDLEDADEDVAGLDEDEDEDEYEDEDEDEDEEMASFHTDSEGEGDSDGESFGDDVPDAALQARMQAHMEAVEAAAAAADGKASASSKKSKGKAGKSAAVAPAPAPAVTPGEDYSEFDLGPAPLPASLLKQAEQARQRALKRATEEVKQQTAEKRRKKRVAKEENMRSIDSRTSVHLLSAPNVIVPPLVPARTHVNGAKTAAAAFRKQAMKRSGVASGVRGAQRSRAHIAMASEVGIQPEHFRR